MLDRPAVGPFIGWFQRRDGEPKNWPTHRILAGNNFTVVLPYRLAGPANAFRFFREIDIHETRRFFCEQQFEHLGDVRLKRRKIRFAIVRDRCTDSNAAQSEQRGLFRSRERAGMPT